MAEFRLPRVLQPAIGVLGRMAGARRGHASSAGSRSAARILGRGAQGAPHAARPGWRSLAGVRLALLFLGQVAQAQVVAARIWPAPEYTRVTLETKEELKYTLFNVKDPERLVLELETAELPAALSGLQENLSAEDPYIKALRVGRNRPG